MGHERPRRAARPRRGARRRAGARAGPAHGRGVRRGDPGGHRRPDRRAGGVRAPAAARRRRLVVDAVAGEPAHVHAPRAELPARGALAAVVRLPARTGAGRVDRGRRRSHRAGRPAGRPGGAVRARGLAAGAHLHRGDRRAVAAGVRHRRPGRGGAVLRRRRDHPRVAAGRRAAHPAAAPGRAAAPGHRPALLVQPGRLPQRAHPRSRDPRVPRRRLRARAAAVHHPFGGGDPIGADVVALLNEVYAAHTLREPWQDGDLLLVDNIRTAHDREAYTGARDVVAGLADPVRLDAGAQ